MDGEWRGLGRGCSHIPNATAEIPTDHEAPDDNNYIDFDLPSLDDHADILQQHPAWPWVCVDFINAEIGVDYLSLTLG